MSKTSKNVKVMIPCVWELFVRYLNYPNYFVKSEDVLAEYNGLTVRFKYKKKLTYSNLLNQFEQ